MTFASARQVYSSLLLKSLKPAPIEMTVSEWADKYRFLTTKSSSEPGPYRVERTPYMREIMDKLGPQDKCKRVVFQKSSQVGATEAINNWLCYIIDITPGPVIIAFPTDKLAAKVTRQRIEPLLQETEKISSKVAKYKNRMEANTREMKDFQGGILHIVGANSANNFRSTPARFTMADDLDGFPIDCGGEGDPVELLEGRTKTFARNKKQLYVSTPVDEETSLIHKMFLRSNQKRYYVPCPHCGAMQWLKWGNLIWDKGHYDNVRYRCESCDTLIREKHKGKMLAAGTWIADYPENTEYAEGYHISALYSPPGWESWSSLAERYDKIRERKDIGALKSFVNTVMGEPWKDKSDAPDWERIYRQREDYDLNLIPKGGLVLTGGADIQKDRIEVEVVAYGKNFESWSIDYRILYGDTSQPAVWNLLEKMLYETWKSEDGYFKKLDCLAIDSGNDTQIVYNWIHKVKQGRRVMAIKGRNTGASMVSRPTQIDIKKTKNKKAVYRALNLYHVNVAMVKEELYTFLRQEPPLEKTEKYPRGYCHFPYYEQDHFKQLVSEERRKIVKRDGRVHYEWVKIQDRNEVLDCRVYARAAAFFLQLDRWSDEDFDSLYSELINNVMLNTKKVDEAQTKEKVDSEKKAIKRKPSTFW